MKNELPGDQLNALLHEWKVDAETPPRFSEGVWQRVARRESESTTWSARWQRWTSALSQRNGFAWGAAAAIVLTAAAAWLGHSSAPGESAAPDASSYLASVDPYRMTP